MQKKAATVSPTGNQNRTASKNFGIGSMLKKIQSGGGLGLVSDGNIPARFLRFFFTLDAYWPGSYELSKGQMHYVYLGAFFFIIRAVCSCTQILMSERTYVLHSILLHHRLRIFLAWSYQARQSATSVMQGFFRIVTLVF